ncbi:hypothetical protein K458DRAFT_81746 [Lentithecium fluviatile CBS 122367]|uniref:Uncharacterized protein n=1 Tax=Lentithecium fluviatile CBS 122367 TaxID=1168545 RepID=A0A6G1ITE7_9PLEO|nr:hypothetical protein K458DRAFT_81746 [Lentithecium fluviatile CBS 122367]
MTLTWDGMGWDVTAGHRRIRWGARSRVVTAWAWACGVEVRVVGACARGFATYHTIGRYDSSFPISTWFRYPSLTRCNPSPSHRIPPSSKSHGMEPHYAGPCAAYASSSSGHSTLFRHDLELPSREQEQLLAQTPAAGRSFMRFSSSITYKYHRLATATKRIIWTSTPILA